jgi:hypothetical protein
MVFSKFLKHSCGRGEHDTPGILKGEAAYLSLRPFAVKTVPFRVLRLPGSGYYSYPDETFWMEFVLAVLMLVGAA